MDNTGKTDLLLKNQAILIHQIKRSRKLVLAQLATVILFFLSFLLVTYLRFYLRPDSFPLVLFLTLCGFLILILWKDFLFIQLFKLNSEALTKIEVVSVDSPLYIGILPFINEVLWFLQPLKFRDSYETEKFQNIEKRMTNELLRHFVFIVVVSLNYLFTIQELRFYHISPSVLSVVNLLWTICIFLSLVRLSLFLSWKNITAKWVSASSEIFKWGREIETKMKAPLTNGRKTN